MTIDATAPNRRFTTLDQFFLSCLWLGYNLQWGALLAIVLPSQIQAMVGPDKKELYNGILGAIGAMAALFVTPIAGALSDRSRSPMGRRRPFLIVGAIINAVFLLYLARFGAGGHFWLFLLGYIGIQFGCNWLGGPYAGMIPDVVPADMVGRASGWQALMNAAGFLIGAVAAGSLIRGSNYWPIYLLILVCMSASLAVTVLGTRERPIPGKPEPFKLGAFIRSFWLDPKTHRNFYWVLITRGFQAMGVYSIFTFFQYFLADVIRVPKDQVETQTGYLIAIIIAMGIPTSIIAGALSDKHGR
ncbi:MAG TPA: MFS transporter, partial [Armatimonadota bacterium]|nr:MFS transporter [Armatimonadota bacterium]